MQESTPTARFTESLLGRVSRAILLVVLLLSMSLSTDAAYSHVPYLSLLLFVPALCLVALLAGYRFPRIPLMAWLSLLIGGYFFWRAASSYSQLEGAHVMSLVLGASIFYVAGLYHGLSKRADDASARFVIFALLINGFYWFLRREGISDLMWWGRPSIGLSGPNSVHVALFLYKNVACAFFAIAGSYLVARSLWLAGLGLWSKGRIVSLGIGVGSIVLSFHCGSRAAYLLLPLLLVLGWFLRMALRAASSRGMRWFDWGFVLAFIAGLALIIFDCAGDQKIWTAILGVDTHLRIDIWRYLMEQVPAAPWCGFGSGACQWQIVPYFYDWVRPNYAHNEYLQCWVDYGLTGLAFMLFLLFGHVLRGVISLSDKKLSPERRVQVAGALLFLLGFSAYAFVDFPWHHFALISIGAFCCGVLASPRGEEAHLRELFAAMPSASSSHFKLLPERGLGRLTLALCCLASFVGLGIQVWRFAPAWKADWDYCAIAKQGSQPEAEMQALEAATLIYPEAKIVNWYLTLPYSRCKEGYTKLAEMMGRCLEANPKNLFAVVLQADFLGRIGRYEEAESLMRDSYVDGGMHGHNLTSWPTYYGVNLLRWGQDCYDKAQWAKAYSIWLYAYHIYQNSRLTHDLSWRNSHKHDMQAYRARQHQRNKNLNLYMRQIKKNLAFMEKIGITPDDSWKLPMRENGQPSLYQNWGNKPYEKKK